MKKSSSSPLLLPLLLPFFFITTSHSQLIYTRYILAIQFSKSLCNRPVIKTCDQDWNVDLPNKFTIHGLWPDGRVGRGPKPLGPQFDINQIYSNVTLRDGLYQNWPDAFFVWKGGDKEVSKHIAAEGFWLHEWNKHGQYSGLNTLGYFRTTFDLYTELDDIYAMFERQGLILPGGKINITEAFDSLQRHLGVKTFMKCLINQANYEFLYEINISYDKATLRRIDVTPYYHTCGNQIVFLMV